MVQEFVDRLRTYNAAYRIGRPIISDMEYDVLVEELKAMDPDNAWLQQIEPAPIPANRKRRLPIPMKSLNKVKSLDEIKTWAASAGLKNDDFIVVTPKFDGLSLLRDEATGMVYSRGGAENEGQDCSAHYKAMRHYPLTGPRGAGFTFGEFVFSKEMWEKYFAGRISPDTNEPYKSPRNTAAGMINRDNPVLETVFVDFFRYGVDENSLGLFESYTDLYKELCEHYNQSYLMWQIRLSDLSDPLLIHIFNQFSQSYYIDGLVLYIDNLDKWSELGRHEGTGNPRYAIAYKNPAFTESFETTVKGIDWKISKAGAMKPVVQIEAVDTGDCTMENPTGYNARWILDNGIGPGAKIMVTRSGGVIPKILKTVSPAPVQLPMYCPNCGSQLTLQDKELVCTNMTATGCDGVKLAKIIFFFKTLGVEDMGEEMFNKLFSNGFKDLKSILDITVADILKIDGFGNGTAEIIIREMDKIKQGIPLATYIHASDCFKTIGKAKADKIIGEMSDETLKSFVDGTFVFETRSDESVTEKYFRQGYEPFIWLVNELQIPIIMPEAPSGPSSDRYQGMNVCFSGVRNSELEAAITDGGGDIASGVSKKTTHLVVKDPNGSSSKITKARQLGIPILTIEAFKAQF